LLFVAGRVNRLGDTSGGRGQIDQGFGCAPVGADRASEPELRIGFGERFAGVRFDEGLLVGS